MYRANGCKEPGPLNSWTMVFGSVRAKETTILSKPPLNFQFSSQSRINSDRLIVWPRANFLNLAESPSPH